MPYSGSNTPAATGTPTRLYARAHQVLSNLAERVAPELDRVRGLADATAGDSYFSPPWPSPRSTTRRRGGRSPPCPRARAIPTSAATSAGASLPVAHHGDARAIVRLGPEALDERRLVVGEQLADGDGLAAGQPSSRATAHHRGLPVTGEHDHPHAHLLQPAHGRRGTRPDPIRERERADHALALDAHAHQTARGGDWGPGSADPQSFPPPRRAPPRPPAAPTALSTHEGSPTNTCLPSTSAEAPRPGTVSAFFARGVFSRRRLPPRRPPRRRVRGGGLDGGGWCSSALTAFPVTATRDPRLALRDGPRLVQRDDADVRRLEHVAAAQQQRRAAAASRRRPAAGVARHERSMRARAAQRRWRASRRRRRRSRRSDASSWRARRGVAEHIGATGAKRRCRGGHRSR